MTVMTCREALILVLGNVDFTKGCCRLTAMVGAALPEEVIEQAWEAIEAEEQADQSEKQNEV